MYWSFRRRLIFCLLKVYLQGHHCPRCHVADVIFRCVAGLVAKPVVQHVLYVGGDLVLLGSAEVSDTSEYPISVDGGLTCRT